jgi:hypothetical protein
MRRPIIRSTVALLSVTVLAPACGPTSDPEPRPAATNARQAESWEGKGNRTIGFVSESGSFRITWSTRSEHPPGTGAFRLTVRSAISGRPIRIVADQLGEGSGTVDFVDDPRMYDFMVDSTNVEWSISAEELEPFVAR